MQLNGQFFDAFMLGNTSARARTAVVLPEPFEPLMRTPPIPGLTAFRMRASLRSWSETMAEKGKVVASDIVPQGSSLSVLLMKLSKDIKARATEIIIAIFERVLSSTISNYSRFKKTIEQMEFWSLFKNVGEKSKSYS